MGPDEYYTQVVGALSQGGIALEKDVPYKITLWVKIGDDYDDYTPDVAAQVRLISQDTFFDIDGDREVDVQNQVTKDIRVPEDVPNETSYHQISLSFLPDRDCTATLEIEKFLNGDSTAKDEWGFWMHIDDIAVEFDNLQYVN